MRQNWELSSLHMGLQRAWYDSDMQSLKGERIMVYEITDDNFEREVAGSDVPCVIEFTAGWCTMCDEMVPTFEELSEEYGDRVKFCIVNTDLDKGLRIKFAVAAFPYIVMVCDGMKTPLFDELVSADRLRERIDFMLEGGKAPTTRPL